MIKPGKWLDPVKQMEETTERGDKTKKKVRGPKWRGAGFWNRLPVAMFNNKPQPTATQTV